MKLDRSILTTLAVLALMSTLVAVNPFGRNLVTRAASEPNQVAYDGATEPSP
jgi:hypothetical protein